MIGYAPTPARDRKVINAQQYDRLFPALSNEKITLSSDASVDQIVAHMAETVKKYSFQVRKALSLVKGSNTKNTVRNVFDFVFKYIKYDTENGEILRTPAATWHYAQKKARVSESQEHSADCDCMSIFIASFLRELNIPYHFIVTSYADSLGVDHGYQHVYVIVPYNDRYLKVDPVYGTFNEQKKFNNYKIFDMNGNQIKGIPVTMLNGIDGTPMAVLTARNWIAQNPKKAAFGAAAFVIGVSLLVSPAFRNQVTKPFTSK